MPRMQTQIPTRKVAGGAIVGALATLIFWGFDQAGYPVPPEVAVAISTLAGFVVAYFVPPASRDQIVADKAVPGGAT